MPWRNHVRRTSRTSREDQGRHFNGRKIDAIKKYRAITREGLKESKDFIEALEVELRASNPEKFTVPPRGKGWGLR
jgi:ribosomal protein L7/L12